MAVEQGDRGFKDPRIADATHWKRAPLEESRKWGIYFIINLLFKTYFKLNSVSLSRTILKALSAYQGDMPPLGSFPSSQQVTFKYYAGVLAFLEENYQEVRNTFFFYFSLCSNCSNRRTRPTSNLHRHGNSATKTP